MSTTAGTPAVAPAATGAPTATGATDAIIAAGARHRDVPRRVPRGIWRAVWTGASGGLFALVLLTALVVIVVPKVAGATPLTILTSSMEPVLPPGTLIVVKPEPVDRIAIGDVVTYQIRPGRPDLISHRVVGVTMKSDGTRSFTTKGDNNSEADPTVTAKQVRGVLWYSVPWLGYVSMAVSGAHGSWLVPAAAVLLLGYAAYMIGSALVSRARRRRRRHRAAPHGPRQAEEAAGIAASE